MPGLRAKLRNRDHGLSSITGANIATDTIEINDLKKLDAGDATGVNAETLPYNHTSLTPTIHDKIESIVAGIDWRKDEFIGDGLTPSFALTYAIDLAQPRIVFYNGQQMTEGASNDYTFVGLNLVFNFIPVASTPIYILYQEL